MRPSSRLVLFFAFVSLVGCSSSEPADPVLRDRAPVAASEGEVPSELAVEFTRVCVAPPSGTSGVSPAPAPAPSASVAAGDGEVDATSAVAAALESLTGLPQRVVTRAPCGPGDPGPGGAARVDFWEVLTEEQTEDVAAALSSGYDGASSIGAVEGTGAVFAVRSGKGAMLEFTGEQESVLRSVLGVYSVGGGDPVGFTTLEYVGSPLQPEDLERVAGIVADAADVERSGVELYPLRP